MNLTHLTALALFACSIHASGSAEAPRLIVRGDDMGGSQAGNSAIIACHRSGIETSVEIIVPAPWFPEAVRLLNENSELDVGVHLTLTSEWDAMKWRPLTAAPSLVDADGYFLPMIWPNPDYPGLAIRERAWSLTEIEHEFRAQIETARRHIPRLSHITGHMGCTHLAPEVAALTKRLAGEYRLLVDLKALGVVDLGYAGAKKTSEEKIESFIKTLESLEQGKTYLFIDHPGLDTPEMRAIGNIGYADVALDRQGVTDTWTSPRVKEAITRLGIELISYGDLREAAPGQATAAHAPR